MPVTARLELVGDANEVLALAGRLGLKPYLNPPQVIPEPAPDHTEPVVSTSLVEPLPPVVQQERTAPPVREAPPPPAKRQPAPKDERGLTAGHREVLAGLKVEWLTTAELADLIGRPRVQGVGNQLKQLAERGLCERRVDGGQTQYRIGPPPWEQQPEPVEEMNTPPTTSPELPPRAPTLNLGDLIGHSLKVAWALHDHGELTRGQLASAVELPEDDVRETLRLCIKQGYVQRVDGNVVRYALTDDVRREESQP